MRKVDGEFYRQNPVDVMLGYMARAGFPVDADRAKVWRDYCEGCGGD